MYRYDHFKVVKAKLIYKNTEIGLEFTDACLGVLRNIIENRDVKTTSSSKVSRTLIYKKQLVYELINRHRNFFEHIDLFELDDKGLLERIDMRKYINLFQSKYLKEKELYGEVAEVYGDSKYHVKRKPRKIPYRQ